MRALRAGRVFDGAALVEPPVVLLDGATILAAGATPPDGADVEDLGADVTLLPGLVDTHQHLCFDGVGTLEEQVAGVDDDALVARARIHAVRALHAGVTTLRDLGDRGWVTLGLRNAADLPTILAAGPPITRPDGHCWYLGGGCAGQDELRAAVAERAERGCDVVKVMVTGGFLTNSTYPMWATQFSTDELRVVVEEAHRAGLPVAAHCHAVSGIVAALDAGVDAIEHCTFLTGPGRCEPAEDLLERLASSGVAVSATLGRLPGAELPPEIQAVERVLVGVRTRLVELGATVVAGTDAGINPVKPHDVLPHALRDFLAFGASAWEGLRAMTSVAAGVCRVADRKGRLAPGFDADLLAVHGDPAADAGCLTDVAGVWKAGTRVV